MTTPTQQLQEAIDASVQQALQLARKQPQVGSRNAKANTDSSTLQYALNDEWQKFYSDATQQIQAAVQQQQLADAKQVVEHVCQNLVQQYTSDAAKASSSTSCVHTLTGQLILLSIELSRHDIADAQLPLLLINDAIELTSILSGVQQLFNELVTPLMSVITALHAFPIKSKLLFLRLCNSVLKRLSRSSNTAFAGDVLLLIASVLPIDERSGLNLGNKFNVNNVTIIEDNQAADADSQMQTESVQNGTSKPSVDKKFYQQLWSMQQYCSNPPLLRDTDAFTAYTSSIDSVLQVFSSHPLTTLSTDSGQQMFYPKYLTSSKLLHLQLQDSHFRRHILLQLLFVNHYLINPSGADNIDVFASDEERAATLPATPRAGKNNVGKPQPPAALPATQQLSSIAPAPFVSTAQLSQLRAVNNRILQLLRSIPPGGDHFTKLTVNLLQNERAYIQWKAAKCPELPKTSVDVSVPLNIYTDAAASAADGAKSGGTKRKADALRKFSPAPSHLMGSSILEELWQQDETWHALSDDFRKAIPTQSSLLDPLIEEELDDSIENDEDKQMSDKRTGWRALRVLLRSDILQFLNSGGSLPKIVKHLAQQQKQQRDKSAAQQQNGAASQHVVQSEVLKLMAKFAGQAAPHAMQTAERSGVATKPAADAATEAIAPAAPTTSDNPEEVDIDAGAAVDDSNMAEDEELRELDVPRAAPITVGPAVDVDHESSSDDEDDAHRSKDRRQRSDKEQPEDDAAADDAEADEATDGDATLADSVHATADDTDAAAADNTATTTTDVDPTSADTPDNAAASGGAEQDTTTKVEKVSETTDAGRSADDNETQDTTSNSGADIPVISDANGTANGSDSAPTTTHEVMDETPAEDGANAPELGL